MVSEKGRKGIEVTLKVAKMLVGARRAGLSASQTAERLEFSQYHNHLWGLKRMVPKIENIQREAVVWRKMLLMSGGHRLEWADWLETMETLGCLIRLPFVCM